jgi:hypothetical protein
MAQTNEELMLENLSKNDLVELLQLAFRTLDSTGSYFAEIFQEFPQEQWDEFDSEANIACDIDDAMTTIALKVGVTFKPIFSPEDRGIIDAIDFNYDEEYEDEDDEDYDDDDEKPILKAQAIYLNRGRAPDIIRAGSSNDDEEDDDGEDDNESLPIVGLP